MQAAMPLTMYECCIARVAICQIFYTQQIFQTKVYPHEKCINHDKLVDFKFKLNLS